MNLCDDRVRQRAGQAKPAEAGERFVARDREGAGLLSEDAGEHELKGLGGVRRVYRLVGLETD